MDSESAKERNFRTRTKTSDGGTRASAGDVRRVRVRGGIVPHAGHGRSVCCVGYGMASAFRTELFVVALLVAMHVLL
jgi:hypothetical protein